MSIQTLLHTVDRISTWFGKAFAWLIVALMLLVAANGMPTPAHTVRQMPKAELVQHLLTFAQAGLSAIARQIQADAAIDAPRKRGRLSGG